MIPDHMAACCLNVTVFSVAMPVHLFSRGNRSCGSFSQSMGQLLCGVKTTYTSFLKNHRPWMSVSMMLRTGSHLMSEMCEKVRPVDPSRTRFLNALAQIGLKEIRSQNTTSPIPSIVFSGLGWQRLLWSAVVIRWFTRGAKASECFGRQGGALQGDAFCTKCGQRLLWSAVFI